MKELTVLHTSDWHLGHQLYRRRRTEEFESFIAWLVEIISANNVDVIVISGDIFDSPLPAPAAQRLYYGFLAQAARAGVRHIVVTAGNHDSAPLLEVAGDILKYLNIHIIGVPGETPAEEIRVLYDDKGDAELIVCAAPYLRERDLATAEPGQTLEERQARLAQGIQNYYKEMARLAEIERAKANREIPVLAMGHLFASGGVPGDGVRELYIGSLGVVSPDIFSATFDYVALGHLHRPQSVGGRSTCRYSGSPLPMSFDEAVYRKSVVLIRFSGREASIEEITVPMFRNLKTVRGTREQILSAIRELSVASDDPGEIWVEVIHEGKEHPGDIDTAVRRIANGTALEILCVRAALANTGPSMQCEERSLEDFDPEEMFALRMEEKGVSEAKRPELMATFRELLNIWQESQGRGQ